MTKILFSLFIERKLQQRGKALGDATDKYTLCTILQEKELPPHGSTIVPNLEGKLLLNCPRVTGNNSSPSDYDHLVVEVCNLNTYRQMVNDDYYESCNRIGEASPNLIKEHSRVNDDTLDEDTYFILDITGQRARPKAEPLSYVR